MRKGSYFSQFAIEALTGDMIMIHTVVLLLFLFMHVWHWRHQPHKHSGIPHQ